MKLGVWLALRRLCHQCSYQVRVTVFLLLGAMSAQAIGQEDSPQSLASRYQTLRAELASNALGLPLRIESREQGDLVQGEVYALQERPFGELQSRITLPQPWCELALLHIDISACTHTQVSAQDWITFYSAGKSYATPERSYALQFDFQKLQARSDYVQLLLQSDSGPFGTSDYRITLAAIPVPQGSFLRMSYAFRSSTVSRLATQIYLSTLGRDKLGFTVVGSLPDGSPDYIRGMRGVIERNVLRYYFALQAFMESQDLPPAQQFAHASERWFDLAERYPRQLHEMERSHYLDIKRREYEEQLGRLLP